MATVFDVARYILRKQGSMTAMKLQKLVYYCQAWSLVWDERRLFAERIEAWANGPVAPDLYAMHRGLFELGESDIKGNPEALTEEEADTVDQVLKFYGHQTSQWLSELSHSEPPWKDARGDLRPGDRGCAVIPTAAMAEYYGAL